MVTVYSAASDIILIILPIVLVWPLQMRQRLKMVIYFLLSLGVLAAIASIVTIFYVNDFYDQDFSCKRHVPNSWTTLTILLDALVDFIIWAKATVWLVLILTSLAPLNPLFELWVTKALSFGSSQRLISGQKDDEFVSVHQQLCHFQTTGSNSASDSKSIPKQSMPAEFIGRVNGSRVPRDDIDDMERVYLGL